MKKLLLINIFFLLCFTVMATNYYVAITGNDANDGSSGSPWLTISHACATVEENQGHVIHLGAGIFTETNIITVPSGVSLMGAGSSLTSIVVNHYYTITDFNQWLSTTYHPEQYVIQLNGSNQTIKGFSMDGQGKKCIGGIYARHAVKVVFDDLKIENFKTGGIFIEKGHEDCEVKFCYIKNSSWADKNSGDTGNLMFDYGKNLSIHDNYIEEQGAISPDYGGYCIKRAQQTQECDWYCENQMFMGTNDGYKIYNNTLIAPQGGAWNNGQAPAMTIEMCGGISKNCEIYNNNLNNTISLVGQKIGGIYSGKSVRVHHNVFNMEHGRYAYAVEADLPGIEIDHNIFNGGETPIAAWDGRDKNQLYSHSVHHNVFYAPAQHIGNNHDLNFFLYNTPPTGKDGYQFYNNTLIDVYGTAHIFAVAGDKFENGDFRNNIFMSTFGDRGDILRATGKTMSNNLFYNISEVGINNINADPLLKLNGDMPIPFFELQAASPAINVGVAIPGITDDANGLPDLGAYETGIPAWKAGVMDPDNEAPTAPVDITGDPKSQFINLSWKSSYDNNYVTEYLVYQDVVLIGKTTGITLKVTGLTPSTAYVFMVKATDISGNISAASNSLNISTLPPDTELPSAPASMSATQLTFKSVVLNWNKPTDNEGILKYEVYKDGVLYKETEDTTMMIKGLYALITYSFTVKSIDYTGNISIASDPFLVTTLEGPVLDVTANDENVSTGEGIDKIHDGDPNSKWLVGTPTAWIQFAYRDQKTWRKYAITSGNDFPDRDFKDWTLKASNDGANWSIIDTRTGEGWTDRNFARTFEFTNDNAFKYYLIDITAFNGATITQASEIVFTSGNDTEAPTAPVGLIAGDITHKSFKLSWIAATDNETLTNYEVFQDGNSIGSIIAKDTSYNVVSLQPSTKYILIVKAKDFSGNISLGSTPLEVTTLEPPALEVTAQGENLPNEGIEKIHDGVLNSKWLYFSATSWVLFHYQTARVWNSYAITSGNDSPGRDPREWTLQGSNDNVTWTVLDTKTGESWPDADRNVTKTYTFANTEAYKYYKWDITANSGESLIQVSEFAFVDTEAPVLAGVPADVAAASCSLIPVADAVTANDNFDLAPAVTLVEVSTQVADATLTLHYTFTITRIWTATDVAGNQSTPGVQVIHVSDNEAPVLAGVPADIAIASCSAIPAVANVTAGDNCDPAPPVTLVEVSTKVADATLASHYTYTITHTWTAIDVAGNHSVPGVQIIHVSDTEAPVLTVVPENVNVNYGSIPVAATVTTADNCDPLTVATFVEESTQVADATLARHYAYTITRTWTGTDVSGNHSSGIQVINVTDQQAPTAPVSVIATDVKSTSLQLSWAASTDNGAVMSYEVFKDGVSVGTTTSVVTSLAVNSIQANTKYTFTVKATDVAGNTSAASAGLDVTTSIGSAVQNVSEKNVNVYPNPCSGILSVELPNTERTIISVFDIYGREVYNKTTKQLLEKIDLSAYKGMLLIKIYNQNSIITKQVIIE